MKQAQKLALIAACAGVNIGDFIPAEPIRIGNKSLPISKGENK